jgi:hypothetical protein
MKDVVVKYQVPVISVVRLGVCHRSSADFSPLFELDTYDERADLNPSQHPVYSSLPSTVLLSWTQTPKAKHAGLAVCRRCNE